MAQADIRQLAEAATRAFQAERLEEAESYAMQALRAQPGEPQSSEILGRVRLNERRFNEAIEYLEAGFKGAPESPVLANLIGTAYAGKAKFDIAIGYFQMATEGAPDHPMPWENLGKAAFKLRKWDEARTAFQRCHEIDPNNLEAASGLSRLELRAGNPERALELASGILTRVPDHLQSREVAAEANLELDQFEQALAGALTITREPKARVKNKVSAFSIAGQAAEGLGRFDEAFAHHTAMNKLMADTYKDSMDKAVATVGLELLTEKIEMTPAAGKKVAKWSLSFDRPGPIFVIGFPRCGTKLLYEKLDEHPLLVGAEKRRPVKAMEDAIRADDGPARVAAFTEEDVYAFRKGYWENVAAAGLVVPEGGRTIELKPFYSQHMTAFGQVYPDAKWLFVHRDPRDIILSCFQSYQAGLRSMHEFLEISSAARYYDLVMEAAKVSRESLDLDVIDVAYDDFTTDLNGTVMGLFERMGLPCGDDILRGLSPPPTRKGTGTRWRNYEAQLAPVQDTLDKWVKHFGYD